MCGIAGSFSKDTTERDIMGMTALISHRGPDEFGYYIDDQVALGSARLSIVDLQSGQQPLRHPETGVVVVFNGEIFNYVELRSRLADEGYPFTTHSDTEVILSLYLKYGTDFPRHLNGQFAISVWDPRQEKLLLVRDRFGICPLFFLKNENLFLFASEMKSILAHPGVPTSINVKAIDQIFTFWTTIGETTILDGICELRPGHMLVLNKKVMNISSYWRWPFPNLQKKGDFSFQDAKGEFIARLGNAVKIRLRADVEVGSYLSGGIDSSALVALASDQCDKLKTYSIGFQEESYDERKYQELVTQRYPKVAHKTAVCTDDDISKNFERVIWHAESPIFRTAPVPMNILSRMVASDGIKVVLTGEGSDEILLGYDIFREVKIRRFWQRNPESRSRPQLLKKLYAYLPQFANPRFANMAIESFKGTLLSNSPFYSHLMRWANNSANKIYFSDGLKSKLNSYDSMKELEATLPEDYFKTNDVDRAQYLELVTLLRGYLLSSQGDRMSMGNSIETRFPFLDHEFVEFANGLPQQFKLNSLKDKHILRESMKPYLPDAIVKRPKFAYQAPEIRAFFTAKGRSTLVDEYLNPSVISDVGLFKADLIENLIKKAETSSLSRMGTRDNMAFVQILSAHVFFKQFINVDMAKRGRDLSRDAYFKTKIDMRNRHASQ